MMHRKSIVLPGSTPLVSLKDGLPVTTSRIVAEVFSKNHRDVLRNIDNIVASPVYQERRGRNFAPTSYLVYMANGATRGTGSV